MGGCLDTASTPVLRTRLHPSVSLPCLSTWLRAQSALRTVQTQAFHQWTGLLDSRRRERRITGKKRALAVLKVLARAGFKRLRKRLACKTQQSKVKFVLLKAAFRAKRGRFGLWRAHSYCIKQAFSRLYSRTFPVIQYLSKGKKTALRSAVGLWRLQALRAVSVPAQSRKLAIIRLKKGIKAPMWRLIRRKMGKKSTYTDYFTAIVRLGTGLAGVRLKQSLRLWGRGAEIRGNQQALRKAKALVSLEGLGRLVARRRKYLGLVKWQVWREWRGMRSSAGKLTGKQYCSAEVVVGRDRQRTGRVSRYEIEGKVLALPCFVVQMAPIRKDLKSLSNRSLIHKAQTVFQQAENSAKVLTARCWLAWKETLSSTRLLATRQSRGVARLALSLKGIKQRQMACCWGRIGKRGKDRVVAHTVRVLDRLRLGVGRKALGKWVLWAAGRTGVATMRGKAVQRALWTAIRAKTPFLSLRLALSRGKSLRRVEAIQASKASEWVNRWKRRQIARNVNNMEHKRRKARLEGLIRSRILLNSRFYFLFFVKRLIFSTYMRNFLPKVANHKAKQLLKQSISRLSKQIRRSKRLPALPGLFRDQLERLPREVMAKWRDWAAEERTRRLGERSYLSATMGSIGSSLGLGRLKAFLWRK